MLEDSLNHSDDYDDIGHETGLIFLSCCVVYAFVAVPDAVCKCTAGNNFKVVVRVRPPLPRELNGDKRFQNISRVEVDRTITLSENLPALDDPRADEATAVQTLCSAATVGDGVANCHRLTFKLRCKRSALSHSG